MSIRDTLVITIIFLSVPLSFFRPFYGAIVWTWIAFMNPHRMTWDFAMNYPVAFPVAVATLVGWLLSKEPKRLPANAGSYLVVALLGCLTVSTILAEDSDAAFVAWSQRAKIISMALVIVAMLNSRERLRILCLVTALSLGYFGLKGGVFAVVTGGQHRTYGPQFSFIADNTSLALALTMILPLLYYMARDFDRPGVRIAMRIVFFATILSVVASYSRGAVLALGVVLLLLVLKSRHRLLGSAILAVAFFVLLALVPQGWTERMETISVQPTEASADARIEAWRLAWRLAMMRPVFGWGPQAMEDKSFYDRFHPDTSQRGDVHSSYFQLLAENGFTTFFVWVALMIWCFSNLHRIGRRFRSSRDHEWIVRYSDMLFIGLAAFAVAGAFLEMAFFDLVYHLIGFTIALVQISHGLSVEAEDVPGKAALQIVPLGITRRAPSALIPGR